MLHPQYYVELDKYNRLIERKNQKSTFYNGVFDRYEYPVLTREHIPLTWKYDLDPETNPYFMERLGVNAVMNSGAIYLNGKYYLVARIEGNDRKFNIIIKDGSLMGKTSLEVAEKLNKGEEDDDKKYNACEIAGFKGILKVNTYSGNSKTQHIYFLDVPCGDETYVVNFRLEELYDDDTSEMKNIEEAILKSIKVEKNN